MPTSAEFIEIVKSGDVERVQAALSAEPALANARSESGKAVTLLAAYRGLSDIVQMLIASGATLDLFEASAAGAIDRVKDLVSQNAAAVKSFAPDGFTPFQLACYFGHARVARALITAGSEMEAVTRNQLSYTPLQAAAAKGRGDVVNLLLASGADIQSRNSPCKLTPLHLAAQGGSVAILEALLDAGADPRAAAEGKTPLALAEGAGQLQAAVLLKKRGG
ncbi:MAG: ankyrin repeat domain-containing protein [Planctomycetes bacterium]|nr:ankyrin repeat domain-containing protein [Planctomycetota bacterium]